MDPVQYKKSLMKLKDTDPEFYKYLKENDRNLLEFDISDDGNEIDDDDKSSLNEFDMKHIPNDHLEVWKYKINKLRKEKFSMYFRLLVMRVIMN